MRAIRFLIGALGVAGGLYGAKVLLDEGSENLVATGKWLVGGVVVHDAVLAPATIALAVVAALLWRRSLPGPVVVGGIVLATVTIVAIPVLGRFGAHADNPTLLDRSYGVGWLVFAGVTVLAVVVRLARPGRHSAPRS